MESKYSIGEIKIIPKGSSVKIGGLKVSVSYGIGIGQALDVMDVAIERKRADIELIADTFEVVGRIGKKPSELESELQAKDKEIERLLKMLSDLPQKLHDSLGETHGQAYTIRDSVGDGKYWITHNEIGSGEPLEQWIKSVIESLTNK